MAGLAATLDALETTLAFATLVALRTDALTGVFEGVLAGVFAGVLAGVLARVLAGDFEGVLRVLLAGLLADLLAFETTLALATLAFETLALRTDGFAEGALLATADFLTDGALFGGD